MQHQSAIILSAEFIGFQHLVDKLSPKDINSLMKSIYGLIDHHLRLNQAELNRYTGDTFLAVFEKSKSDRSCALRALNAAFEIKELMRTHLEDEHMETPLYLKFGMASGNILITEIHAENEKHKTVLGDGVNIANRICQFASKNQIIIDKNTYEEVKSSFDFQALEPIPLEGGSHSIEIFEALQKKRIKLHIKGVSKRQIDSEMVGRHNESEHLENLIKKLIAGKGSVVNIVGKAGIGKSRLMDEMKVQPFMEKILLLEGRALSNGQNLSYHPIVHLIKSWAQITEEDLPSVSSEKLQKGIQHIAPNQADDIYAFIATMMGLPLSGKHHERVQGIEGEALEKLILKNLRDLIISATKDQPRIYLVEDMHWADSSSITFFESLYKLSQNYPVMFINVLRPGYKETGDYILKWLVDHLPGDNMTINISPLEERESGELISNLLKKASLPEKVANTIIRKTEGNPFFIEEVLRSFLDEGVIEVKDQDFIVTAKIKDVNIPETINDAILSRVDKLDIKTRELLNTASVMGRNFYYKVLEEATDTIDELDDRLAYLSEVQLISEDNKKQEIEYLFKHALAQQLTYDSIIQQSRKDLHYKIARSIEKVFAQNINEFYGTLVYHYKMAENKEKTIHYQVLAGDESMNSGASSEALNFYKDALDSMPENRKQDVSDLRIRALEIKIALAYHILGKNAIAVEYYEIIMRKYFNFSFAKSENGLLISGIISMLFFRFMINNQSLFFKRKVNPELDILLNLLNNWGYAYIHLNPKHFALKGLKALVFNSLYNIPQSLPALSFFIDTAILFNFTGISLSTAQKIINFSQKSGIENHPLSFINFRMAQCVQNYFCGKWDMESDFTKAYNEGLRMGKYMTTLTYIYYTGMCAIESGNYKEFKKRIEILDDLAESLDIRYAMILKYRLITMGYLKFRELQKLYELSDEGINYIISTGDKANLFMIYCMKAQGCLYLSKTSESDNALSKVEGIIDKYKNIPIFFSQYLVSKLENNFNKLKGLKKETQAYKTMVKQTNKIWYKLNAQSKKNIACQPLTFLIKAQILYFLDKYSQSVKYFKYSISAGEKYNALPDLSRAYFETGRFLSDPNVKYKELNGKSGSHYLNKAKIMFEEMDLKWDLEEYKKFIKNEKTKHEKMP